MASVLSVSVVSDDAEFPDMAELLVTVWVTGDVALVVRERKWGTVLARLVLTPESWREMKTYVGRFHADD